MNVYSLDWIQLFCSGTPNYPKYYTVVTSDYGTRQFKTLQTISIRAEEYCIVVSNPRSSIMPENSVIVKLINKQCYKPEPIATLLSFIESCNLALNNFTRLDFALDFHHFKHNMSIQYFLTKFINEVYLKTKKSKFTLIGNQHITNVYDYFRIGANKSDLSAYLYNKTKEMEQVKDKPYIRERWEANELTGEAPVYRLEFSLKRSKVQFWDDKEGMFRRLDIRLLDDPNYLKMIYHELEKTAFRFKINNYTANKSRMRSLQLFDIPDIYHPVIFESDKKEGNRTSKIVINFLENMNNEIRQIRQHKNLNITQITKSIANEYGLAKWLDNKTNNK